MSKISLSKVKEKKGDDSNYALVNVKTDSAEWTNNNGKQGDGDSSMFNFGWTDLLEILILSVLVFFLYQYFKKRMNKTRKKKLTRTTRNLVAEMKASKDACSISMPTAPSMTSIAMPAASTMVPFQPAQTTMVVPTHVPTHKAMSGIRAIPYTSNIYEPP